MQPTMVEQYAADPEGMKLFQQERVILETAILIRRLLKERGLTKADLAAKLGRSKSFVTQLLNGHANMTLRTLSDIMCVLNRSLSVSAQPLEVSSSSAEPTEVILVVPHSAASGFWADFTPIHIGAQSAMNLPPTPPSLRMVS